MLIESMKFIDQKNKFILIPYFLEYLVKNGNLHEQLVNVKMTSLLSEPMFKPDSDIWTGKDRKENEENYEKLALRMKERYDAETREYFPILFNLVFITSCSLFDAFMITSFQAIIDAHPNLIDPSRHAKAFKTVERGGMLEKKEKFQEVGVNFEEVFKFGSLKPTVLEQYPNGEEFLENIYKIRNDIVHRNILPIQSYQELSDLTDFLQYTALSMAAVIKDGLGIDNDFYTYLSQPINSQ